jgi:hypothetical protein
MTVLGLMSALALPATAAAHHGHGNSGTPTFERVFRFEARLCAAVDAGNAPTPLQGSEAQVKEACTALHAAFDAAVSAAGAGTDATALKDAVATVQTACAGDTVDQEACADALRGAYKALKTSRRGDKHAYKRALNQARRDFRDAIKPLIHREATKPVEPGDNGATGDVPSHDKPALGAPTDD